MYWKMTLSQIAKNRLRTVLTILGIVIGVAALIAVITVGNAGRNRIYGELEKFGVNRIFFFLDSPTAQNTLVLKDVAEIESEFGGEVLACAQSIWKTTVGTQNASAYFNISATSETLGAIENKEMKEGRFLSYYDVSYARKVIVLSNNAAEELFGTNSAVGRYVRVNGTRFEVIGVEQPTTPIYSAVSSSCYVPISTFQQQTGVTALSEISLLVLEEKEYDTVSEEVIDYVLGRHGKTDLRVMEMGSVMKNAQSILNVFELIIGAIAAISLLVGGIGIMNIMLVTVRERTREIGIRKALGATESSIRKQFMFEAILYSVIGSIIGVALGGLFSKIAGDVIGLQPHLSVGPVAFGVIFSILIGLVFGILPACRAAKLKPVDALRQE